MAIPNPSALVRKQSEAVATQFDSKKAEIISQIEGAVGKQISEVRGNEAKQVSAINSKIAELQKIKGQMDPSDPRISEVARQIGIMQEQRKQVKAQVKLAIASILANAARERENIKTRLERQKQQAIQSAVDQALAQFSMLMQQRKMQAEGAMADELRSGNRG